jgi:hypothetical protein
VPKRGSRALRAAAIGVAVVLLAVAGGYLAYHRAVPVPSGCQTGGRQPVALDTEQAAIAATIAGVAHARRLPPAAVTIAYATALQESKMHDLPNGDLDSVGVFQQRPSQGWGTPRQLTDPVYSTGKFFAALVKVPGYLRMPLYQAAQDVQHSADGSAYTNYQEQAAIMSRAFTGGTPHAVWCWSGSGSAVTSASSPDTGAMRRQLLRTFGRLNLRQVSTRTDPATAVRVIHPAAGWAVASWLVTHATAYRISDVRYAGYQWSATAGNRGWTRDPAARSGTVELR